MKATENTLPKETGPLTTPPETVADVSLDSPAERAELPLTLLCAGYHLRLLNAMRARFDGRAERVVIPMLLWLAAQVSDADPEIVRVAEAALDGIALGTRPARNTLSLREIEIASGLPRETVRRTAARLARSGWIVRDLKGRLTVTPQFTGCLQIRGELERLEDFRWTAARVSELLDPSTSDTGASVPDALAAMRARRVDELHVSLGQALALQPVGALSAAVICVHGYNLRHILRLAPFFDGDLLQVVLLGEIAHGNIAALAPDFAKRADDLHAALKMGQPQESLFRNPRFAFNTHSLALSLGIPYETARRKLAQLSDRGYIRRDDKGLHWVLPHVADVFAQFNRERRIDMLATAHMIEALLQSAIAPAAPSQT